MYETSLSSYKSQNLGLYKQLEQQVTNANIGCGVLKQEKSS